MRCLCILTVALAGIGPLAAVGCNEGSDTPDDVPAGVLARIGEVEISARDLRTSLPPAANLRMRTAGAESLIAFEWIRQEARRQGIRIRPLADRQGIERLNAQGVQAIALVEKLLARVAGPAPSERDVARYYRDHPLEYSAPKVWMMKRMPMTTRTEGVAAKRALDRGGAWSDVFRRYADTTTHIPPPRGRIGEPSNTAASGLVKALSAARRGEITGPVRARYESATEGPKIRWYVFTLISERDLPGQSLAQARGAITALLEERHVERAHKALRSRLEDRYRPETTCSKRLLVPECANGPQGQRLGLMFLGR